MHEEVGEVAIIVDRLFGVEDLGLVVEDELFLLGVELHTEEGIGLALHGGHEGRALVVVADGDRGEHLGEAAVGKEAVWRHSEAVVVVSDGLIGKDLSVGAERAKHPCRFGLVGVMKDVVLIIRLQASNKNGITVIAGEHGEILETQTSAPNWKVGTLVILILTVVIHSLSKNIISSTSITSAIEHTV